MNASRASCQAYDAQQTLWQKRATDAEMRSWESEAAVKQLRRATTRLPLDPGDGWQLWGDADTIALVPGDDAMHVAARTPEAWKRVDGWLRQARARWQRTA